jgi:phosphoribosylformylglycinamidine synthase
VDAVIRVLTCPDMASKRWLWEQYDRHVMADTLQDSATGADAGVVRVHGTDKGLAMTSDCTPRYVQADPYEGGKQAVAEAYRNLSAVGATPIAITDNLNFGNPEKPDTMGVIVKAIEGMAEACRVLDFPVVSGNVSLYNETDGVGIPPTPVVGGIGLIEDVTKIATLKGAKAGDALYLLAMHTPDSERHTWLGASAYARVIHGVDANASPRVDLAAEKRNGAIIRDLIGKGLVSAVHDISEGGLAAAIGEMALASGVGASFTGGPKSFRQDELLFGEVQARYVFAVPAAKQAALEAELDAIRKAHGDIFARLGAFGGDSIVCADAKLSLPLSALRAAHEGWLPTYMSGGA